MEDLFLLNARLNIADYQGKVLESVQSNLSYPGALGLGGARNSDLSVSQNAM